MPSDRKLFICFLGFLLSPFFVILVIVIMIGLPSNTKVSYTPSVVFITPETEAERLARLERESSEILDWILNSVDLLSRCIASGKTDWELRGVQLEMFSLTLEGAGEDWLDGRQDSYSIYEVERAVDGAEQTINEIKTECGIR